MPKDFADVVMEAMRDDARERVGFNEKTPLQLFEIAHRVLDLLPVERMTRLVEELTRSSSEMDRLQARQLSILLFARQEMEQCLRTLTREQSAAIARELGVRR